MEHGTSTTYGKGCRCDVCRAGRAAYAREWRKRNPDSGKVERSCEKCGASFMAWPDSHRKNTTNKFCSPACAGNVPGTGRRANVFRPGHALAGTDGRVQLHRYRLYEAIGPGSHECVWCGATVTWTARSGRTGTRKGELVVDHLDSNTRNNDITNLAPSCHGCNGLRGVVGAWELRTGRSIEELSSLRKTS